MFAVCSKDDACLRRTPGASLTAAELERAIAACVRRFYDKAHADPLLGPVMTAGIADLEAHIATVSDFWSRTLLGTARYQGRPYPAHTALALAPEHFDRWLALFAETAQATLPGVQAAQAIAKSQHMAACFKAGLFPFAAPNAAGPAATVH
jgi:hemoglobin